MIDKFRGENQKRLKFLLINPTAEHWRVGEKEIPRHRIRFFRFSMLTSLYVAAATPSYVETQIIDEDVEPIDFETDADLIGISFMTFNAPRAYEIAEIFKSKGKTVIFGGYHPSFMPDEAIKHCDAICIGEAENNLPKMIDDYMSGYLKRFYENELVNLKGLPIPNRNLLKKSAYITPDAVQATRGCPNQCRFCSISSFFRHKYRTRPVAEVIDELKTLGKVIIFMDDNIIGKKEYAKELFAKMIPLQKLWFSQCGINIADDEELLRLAKLSGCGGLFVGLESIVQDSLQGWNKNFNRAKDYLKAINRLHSQGIAVYAAVVFGADKDTVTVFSNTLEFLFQANVDALQATILTPFPGTEVFTELAKQGRIIERDWSKYNFGNVVFEPKNMSRTTLRDGHDWVLTQFYSHRSILQRAWRAFSYLPTWFVFKGFLSLNYGYKDRLTTNQAIRRFDNKELSEILR